MSGSDKSLTTYEDITETKKSPSQDASSEPTVTEVMKHGRNISRTVNKDAKKAQNTVKRPPHEEAATLQEAQEDGEMPKGALRTTATGAADDAGKGADKLGESADHEADEVKKSRSGAAAFLKKSREMMKAAGEPPTLDYSKINNIKQGKEGPSLDYSKMKITEDSRPAWKRKMDMKAAANAKPRGMVMKVKKSVEDDMDAVEEEARKMAEQRNRHSRLLHKAAATKNPNDLSNLNASRQNQAITRMAKPKMGTGMNTAGLKVAQNAATGKKQATAGVVASAAQPKALIKSNEKHKQLKARYEKVMPKHLATTKGTTKHPSPNGYDGVRHNDGVPSLTKDDNTSIAGTGVSAATVDPNKAAAISNSFTNDLNTSFIDKVKNLVKSNDHEIRPETFVDKKDLDFVNKKHLRREVK